MPPSCWQARQGPGCPDLGTLCVVASRPMTSLTTGSIAQETLTDVLLALEDLTTRLTVLALNVSANPDQMPRLRVLLEDLGDDLDRCEGDLGTYCEM